MAENEVKAGNKKKSRWTLIWRTLLAILVIFLLLSFSLSLPVVQQWGVKRITNYLTKRLETNVSVKSFHLNVFKHLRIDDIYIEHPERNQDTLLYSQNLDIKFNSLLNLVKGRLTIHDVSLSNGLLRFERTRDHGKSTIAYLLEKLASKTKKDRPEKSTFFDLDLHNIGLNNMRLSYMDGIKSMNQFYKIQSATFDVDEIDFEKRILNANRISIENSNIQMVKTNAPISEYWDSIFNLEVLDTLYESPWKISIADLNVENIQLDFDNYFKSSKPRWPNEYVDLHHFSFDDIDIQMKNFSVQDLVFNAEIENIHLLHKNGFEIERLSAEKAYLDEFNLKLDGWVLQTADTYIRDNITLSTKQYEDYETLEDLVHIELNTPGSKILIRDFVRMVPSLSSSAFFQKNMDKIVLLKGVVNGPINALNVQDMNLKIGGLELAGDFKSTNLANGAGENLILDVDSSFFLVQDLEAIIPDLEIPSNFNQLGLISFKGDFEGSFEDFIAFGDFGTELGSAKADVKLNLIEGKQQASYTGSLALSNFDLGTFTGNEELGRTSFNTRIIKGRGLTQETATVDLDGSIDFIEYSGYRYEDIALKGNLNQRLFDGSVSIHNDDIDLDFNGLIDQRDSIPNYIFKAAARNLNLYKLNLMSKPMAISGNFDVDMRALNLDQLFGLASGKNIIVVDSSGEKYSVDSFSIESKYDDIDFRILEVNSGILQGRMVGDFKIRQVVPVVKRHLKEFYPRFFANMQLPDSIYRYGNQRFNFGVNIDDSENWFNLLGVQNLRIKKLQSNGNIDTRRDLYNLDGMLGELHYNNFNIYNTEIKFEEIAGQSNSQVQVVALDINEKLIFEDIFIDNIYGNDSLQIKLNTKDLTQAVNTLDVVANIYPQDDSYTFHIKPFDLTIFDKDWTLNEENKVEIWDDRLTIEDFSLSNGEQEIEITSLGNKGMEAKGAGFDVAYLNDIWDYERLNFTGDFAAILKIEDLFEFEKYSINLNSPQLSINDSIYGVLNLDVNLPSLYDQANIDISIIKDEREIVGKGYYYLPVKEVPKALQNDWYLDVDVKKLPMMFWQFIIGDNISNTEGYVNADLILDSKITKTNIQGTGRVFNGKTKVNYLGTTYSFHDQPIKVTPTMIDMTGAILTDEVGNRATVTGGITHRHIKDLGLDAVISSPRFIGLQTTPDDNPTYYGYVVGRLYCTFNGLMDRPTISLNGETAEGTYLALPIDYSTETSETDFVTFTEFTRETVRPVAQEDVLITGVDFNMNVTVNEGATMDLIFNEQTGEILRGVGNGDIQFSLSRNGDMNMTGVYEIKQGNYLFTNFFVRKPFVIKEGGTIRWDGDPLEADLNIEAEYERLRASTALFIEEYLTTGSASARSDASVKTDVDLTMIITGILSEPDLDFRISFPNLNGEVKGYVDSKLRILRSDPNALLEQVMGLLLTRSFLPTNTIVNSTGQVATSSINNTVSELISSQLSNYLSGFFTNAADNIGFINSIEFDVGVDFNPFGQANISSGSSLGSVLTESGNEVEVRTRYRLFDDRLTFDVGGNYTTESPLLAGGKYLAGDYAIEYNLTNDKRLKIRFYHRNDLTIEGRKNKFNLGLTYRREFDNFTELFNSRKSNEQVVN